jgi:hypothetical protein
MTKEAVLSVAGKKKKVYTCKEQYPSESQQNTVNSFSRLWCKLIIWHCIEDVLSRREKIVSFYC